jgi:hypothetical protein
MSKRELRASAAVIARPVRFGDALSWEDRKTLRAIVAKVHKMYLPFQPSNSELDELIDALGPIAQEKMLRAKIEADGGLN